eukprot:3652247-Pleurochrysis_carterae.AAC.1
MRDGGVSAETRGAQESIARSIWISTAAVPHLAIPTGEKRSVCATSAHARLTWLCSVWMAAALARRRQA